MKKLLLLGKNGQVGWELQHCLPVIASDRTMIDLTQAKEIRKQLQEIKPDIVINAAAYNEVEKAEKEKTRAMEINAHAPEIIAEECKKLGAKIIHYSTDYVFDGDKRTPYNEEDKPNPINYYGLTKLEGEKRIQAIGGSYLILRTSWIYGNRAKNFYQTILKAAHEKKILKVVGDQYGVPNWCRMIAEITSILIEKNATGMYHLSSTGQTTWFEFTKNILDLYPNLSPPQLQKISSEEYSSKAQRPKFSVLSPQKIKTDFNLNLPNWKDSLKSCIKS